MRDYGMIIVSLVSFSNHHIRLGRNEPSTTHKGMHAVYKSYCFDSLIRRTAKYFSANRFSVVFPQTK